MNCRDFHEFIDSYLSDELLTETNHDILRHMENCHDCRSLIEARREIRSRLKTAVANAPQYQIDKGFERSLRKTLKKKTLKKQESNSNSWLGFEFGTWATVTAGLVITFTIGLIIFNYSGNNYLTSSFEPHHTESVPHNHIVNIALGNHQFCAVKPIKSRVVALVKTPKKYVDLEKIALPKIKQLLTDFRFKKLHTCKFNKARFTHLVLSNGTGTISLMLTKKLNSGKIGKTIATFSSQKYELAKFDVDETSIFVISSLDKSVNQKVANALYDPIQKYLNKADASHTSHLLSY